MEWNIKLCATAVGVTMSGTLCCSFAVCVVTFAFKSVDILYDTTTSTHTLS
jgi:hypothetical protein